MFFSSSTVVNQDNSTTCFLSYYQYINLLLSLICKANDLYAIFNDHSRLQLFTAFHRQWLQQLHHNHEGYICIDLLNHLQIIRSPKILLLFMFFYVSWTLLSKITFVIQMYLSALSNLFSSSRTSTFTSSRVCIIYQAVTIVDNPTALIDDQYNVFIYNTFLSILVKLSALLSSDFQYLSDTSREDNTRFLIHLKDTIIHTIIELYQVLPFLFLIIE